MSKHYVLNSFLQWHWLIELCYDCLQSQQFEAMTCYVADPQLICKRLKNTSNVIITTLFWIR